MLRGVMLLVLVIVVALAAPGTAFAQDELIGTVTSTSISIVKASGGTFATLAPGTYTLTVRDQSAEQNFHLTGPSVNIATEVEFVGTRTFTVTFRDGTYIYASDADYYITGSFRVGTTTTTTTTTKRLVATVGPGFTITLTRNGRKVIRLKPGTYTIVVRDRSSLHSFHLRGPGSVNRRTTVPFVGTRTWKVKLVRGLYRYNCDAHPLHMRGSFRVAT